MLNDFRGRDFWIINKENKTIYYLRLNGSWMQVTKEVYSIYKSSYQKMYREYQRDKDAVEFTEYVESKYVKETNPLEFIVLNEMKDRLEKAIYILSDDELRIIQAYFYDEQSERQIAEKLGISKTALHYKKTKILEKLKKFIDQYHDQRAAPFEEDSLQKEERVVEKSNRAWIHCRVSKESLRYLLKFQEKRLTAYCESEGMKIIGISKEVSLGKHPAEYYLSIITTMVRRNEIDCIVVYDWTRLLIFADLFMEFKMFCEMNGVEIIELHEP